MKTHRNIPFFVPHAGCPHCCVFCSQVKITGVRAERSPDEEIKELRELLENSGKSEGIESRVAFFGGSFTAIERERMISLLSVADEYIKKGVASGIRISTRPDCIDEEVLGILAEYGVTEIELGVQSTDDKVLALSERGHTAADSFKAADMIIKKGFVFGGQMMVGLPGATAASELQTAEDIVKMGAKESRIYPTAVFKNTKLYDMTLSGEYVPLTTEEAVDRTAACFRVFLDNGVNVLKIGLHSSENLAAAPFGATHPALGELVKSKVYTDIITDLAGDCSGGELEITFPNKDISALTGNGSAGIKRIEAATGANDVKIICADIPEYHPLVKARRKQ
ncbi:MAG: radical SAM protein [Clostridia bacterium]|nr:radical SAM protein [Clostridia bacterium]